MDWPRIGRRLETAFPWSGNGLSEDRPAVGNRLSMYGNGLAEDRPAVGNRLSKAWQWIGRGWAGGWKPPFHGLAMDCPRIGRRLETAFPCMAMDWPRIGRRLETAFPCMAMGLISNTHQQLRREGDCGSGWSGAGWIGWRRGRRRRRRGRGIFRGCPGNRREWLSSRGLRR